MLPRNVSRFVPFRPSNNGHGTSAIRLHPGQVARRCRVALFLRFADRPGAPVRIDLHMGATIAQRCAGARSGTNVSIWRSYVEPWRQRYPFPGTPDRPGASGPRCGMPRGSTSFCGAPILAVGPGLLSFGKHHGLS